MVKDAKYIIKRIIVGVGIALVLSFLRGNLLLQAHAQTIGSYSIGEQIDVINNNNSLVYYNISGAPWANYGDGYLVFDFSVFKVAGSSTSPNVMPSYVKVNSGNASYVCSVGSSSVENSTFNNLIFSAFCPVHLTSSGLSSISIGFQNNQQNSTSDARVYFNGLLTYEQKVADSDIDYNSILGTINANANANSQYTQEAINNASSSITNNQNSNTDKEIESQKVCVPKSLSLQNGGIDGSTGNNIVLNNRKRSDFISVLPNKEYEVSSTSNVGVYVFEYDTDYSFVRYYPASWVNVPYTFTTGSNASYVRFVFNSGTVNNPVFTGCFNGNQAIVDSQQDINNTLNDDSGGEVSSSWFDEFRDNSSTPVSDLLTMPITLLQAYLNGFSGNCQAMNLGQLYGSYIIIPCLNLESYLGSDLWSLIDVIFTLFMLYNIGMLCVTIYEGITSLNDDMQFLYSPIHAGAGNTRVERYGDNY